VKIAIINNKAAARKTLIRIITSIAQHELIWSTSSGVRAMQFYKSSMPDLVIIDPFVRDTDGIALIRNMMAIKSCAILVVTSSILAQSEIVFDALGAGAIDAANTPNSDSADYVEASKVLRNKIDKIGVLVSNTSVVPIEIFNRNLSPFNRAAENNLVIIGCSSGGPNALATIFSKLPEDYQSPIVVVQHVDMLFAPGLAKWLNDKSVLPVQLANEGSKPTPGKILLAATNDHLVLSSEGRLQYCKNFTENTYRPSVDIFFQSVADHWRYAVTALLLTGMGNDGAKGMLALRRRGAHTIAQDGITSVVFGMPKAAIDFGAVVDVLPIDKIAGKLAGIYAPETRKEVVF